MKSTNLAFNFKMIKKIEIFISKILSNTEELKKGYVRCGIRIV